MRFLFYPIISDITKTGFNTCFIIHCIFVKNKTTFSTYRSLAQLQADIMLLSVGRVISIFSCKLSANQKTCGNFECEVYTFIRPNQDSRSKFFVELHGDKT
jgi:hypothetical protein